MNGIMTINKRTATSKVARSAYEHWKRTPFTTTSRYLPSRQYVQSHSWRQNSSTRSSSYETDLLPSTKWLGDLLLQGHSSSADMLLRRVALSRAVTLVESTHTAKRHQADLLLQYLLHKKQEQPQFNNPFVFRLGIAGPPGKCLFPISIST
jgi:hypothetical protein